MVAEHKKTSNVRPNHGFNVIAPETCISRNVFLFNCILNNTCGLGQSEIFWDGMCNNKCCSSSVCDICINLKCEWNSSISSLKMRSLPINGF